MTFIIVYLLCFTRC